LTVWPGIEPSPCQQSESRAVRTTGNGQSYAGIGAETAKAGGQTGLIESNVF
jgi:hypothetical protein